MVPGRCNDSGTVTEVASCLLCSSDDPSPPLTLRRDPCATIALTQAVVQRRVQGEAGGNGVTQSRPQHREVKREQRCGRERVGLLSCVDIMRCFLVVLLCVRSVRTFFLN